jgi:hypothetical protein
MPMTHNLNFLVYLVSWVGQRVKRTKRARVQVAGNVSPWVSFRHRKSSLASPAGRPPHAQDSECLGPLTTYQTAGASFLGENCPADDALCPACASKSWGGQEQGEANYLSFQSLNARTN